MVNNHVTKTTGAQRQSPSGPAERLTLRQLEVLALLCEGLPNKMIGRRLNIADGTVKVHIVQILRALNVSSRLQAAIAARELGMVGAANKLLPIQETASVLQQAAVRRPQPRSTDAQLPSALVLSRTLA